MNYDINTLLQIYQPEIQHYAPVNGFLGGGGLGTTMGFNIKLPPLSPLGWGFDNSVLPQGREDCQRWVDEDSRCTIHDRKPSFKPDISACSYRLV